MKSSSTFSNIFFILLLAYLLIIIFLFFYQRKLLYHPGENNYLDEGPLSHKIEKVSIQSDNDLVGWYYKKNNNFKTLLFFHGNAGKLDNRIYKLNEFADLDLNYLIFAYRGFSGNKGKPTEIGLYKDAIKAKEWLNQNNIEDKDIVLYGESLGTGVATEIAQSNGYAGLVLETPFTSMIEAAKNFYPYIPVSLLLKDKYDNLNKIKNINIPVLVMHGEVDQIVPFWMGKKIYEIANQPKYSHFTKFDDHMMEYDEKLLSALKVFIKSLN